MYRSIINICAGIAMMKAYLLYCKASNVNTKSKATDQVKIDIGMML